MGAYLPAIDLGGGLTVRTASAGDNFVCAIMHSGLVKCWGKNNYGQLGVGSASDHGHQPNTMGASLPFVNLGTSRTATAIATGSRHACALLDNRTVKCWGDNSTGQLGLGDKTSRGSSEASMGDALPAVRLGSGRLAIGLAAGNLHTCALLDNGAVKCWGLNSDGGLGIGDVENRGDNPSEMGNNLPTIALGTGRTAKALSADQKRAQHPQRGQLAQPAQILATFIDNSCDVRIDDPALLKPRRRCIEILVTAPPPAVRSQ